MKATEFVTEDAGQLKAIVTGLVKQTDDEALLHRVYTTLKSNDLTSRLTAVLSKDQDVGSMLKIIAQVIITTEGTVDEKMAFADNYANGYIDIKQLFSKNMPVPEYLNTSKWVEVRAYIQQNNPKALKPLCQLMADSTFNHVTNSMYANALLKGTGEEIKQAIVWTGFSNYKAYSGFDGLLIMSVPKRTVQYFTFVSEMEGQIKVDTTYVLAPEGSMMPKISVKL